MSATETVSDKINKAARNHVFNDLGITKKEIQQVIISVVREQIAAVLSNRQGLRPFIEKRVAEELFRYQDLTKIVQSEVRKQVSDFVAAKLDGRLAVDISTNPKGPTP